MWSTAKNWHTCWSHELPLSFNIMNELQKILADITRLTANIETNYPELYQFLDEDPMTIGSLKHPDTGLNAMKDYLESLKELLSHHLETRKKKNDLT